METLKGVFLNHGEPTASHTLKLKLEDELGIETVVVEPRKHYQISVRDDANFAKEDVE